MPDFYHSVIKFLEEGGIFIFPIGLVLFVGLSIGLERWIYLTLEKLRNRKALAQLVPILQTANKQQMSAYASENNASITRIIGFGLNMMKATKDREDIENALGEGLLDVIAKLKRRTNYTAMLANVATLLGLLGTIIGLIGAFSAVASADPIEKSRILSESISVAMNTTAFGIIVAIPLLVIHALLTNQTQKITNEVESGCVKFLNIMTKLRLIETPSPSATSNLAQEPLQATIPQKTRPQPIKNTDAYKDGNETVENTLSLDDGPIAPENELSLPETSVTDDATITPPDNTAVSDDIVSDDIVSDDNVPYDKTVPSDKTAPLDETVPLDSTVASDSTTVSTDLTVNTSLAPPASTFETPIENSVDTPIENSVDVPIESVSITTPREEKDATIAEQETQPQIIPAEPTKASFVASSYLSKLIESNAQEKPKPIKEEEPKQSETQAADPLPIDTDIIESQAEPTKAAESETIETQTVDTVTNEKIEEKTTTKAVFSVSEPTNISLEEELRLLELKKAELQKKIEEKE